MSNKLNMRHISICDKLSITEFQFHVVAYLGLETNPENLAPLGSSKEMKRRDTNRPDGG